MARAHGCVVASCDVTHQVLGKLVVCIWQQTSVEAASCQGQQCFRPLQHNQLLHMDETFEASVTSTAVYADWPVAQGSRPQRLLGKLQGIVLSPGDTVLVVQTALHSLDALQWLLCTCKWRQQIRLAQLGALPAPPTS